MKVFLFVFKHAKIKVIYRKSYIRVIYHNKFNYEFLI